MVSRLSSQNGEATAVMQDVATRQSAPRETLACSDPRPRPAPGRGGQNRCGRGCVPQAAQEARLGLMRLFEVRMTAHAVRDLEGNRLDRAHDGPARRSTCSRIQKAVDALKRFLSAGRTAGGSRPGYPRIPRDLFQATGSSTTSRTSVCLSRSSPTAGATCDRCWRGACSRIGG